MGREKLTVAGFPAQLNGFGRPPGVGPHNGSFPSKLLGLFNNQGHFIIVLGGKKHLGTGLNNFGQLGRKVRVFCGKTFKRNNGACTMFLFPCILEHFGKSFGVVRGHIIKHSCLGEPELIGDEVCHNRTLERIKEAAAEYKGTVHGGIRVGGPGADHDGFVFVCHFTGRYSLFGRLRADNGQHIILADHFGVGFYRRFCFGFIVFNDQFDLVRPAANFNAARLFNV